MKFYYYPHCPFCQRVQLFLGYKNIPHEAIVLSYDDKETPKKLCGSSTLPIIDFGNGKIMNESLLLIREIENEYPHPIGFIGPVEGLFQWSSMIMTSIPRYFDILLPVLFDHYKEFTDFPAGGKYFQESKEKKRGKTFIELKKESADIFEINIIPLLEPIIEKVEDEYFLMGPTFTVADCVLAADLSGLRLVKNIKIPQEITDYIVRVEKRCRVDLLKK